MDAMHSHPLPLTLQTFFASYLSAVAAANSSLLPNTCKLIVGSFFGKSGLSIVVFQPLPSRQPSGSFGNTLVKGTTLTPPDNHPTARRV